MLLRKDAPPLGRDTGPVNATDLLDVLVSDALASGPGAMRVFRDHGMACIGCPFAPFETVAEVAGIYGLDALELANSLASAGVVAPEKDSTHDDH